MEPEVHLQNLSICNRLYNFIKKTFMLHASKSVKLGDPLHQNLLKPQNKTVFQSDQMANPRDELNGGGDGDGDGDEARVEDNFDIVISSDATLVVPSVEAKAPKKVVSINERVEEIDTSKKRMRRRKSRDNLSLFDKEEDVPKPLKSILKVGSYSGEKSVSFVK